MHKILTASFFACLFVYIVSLPRELRRLKWTTLYTEHITRNSKYESKKLKHRNQNVISQNTMSHIGYTEHITRNSKYESKKLKHRNQNVISQNTMSHIGFRNIDCWLPVCGWLVVWLRVTSVSTPFPGIWGGGGVWLPVIPLLTKWRLGPGWARWLVWIMSMWVVQVDVDGCLRLSVE